MPLTKNTTRFLIVASSLVVLDVLIKVIVVSQFDTAEVREVVPGFLSIGRIETIFGAGLLLSNALYIKFLVRILFHSVLAMLAIRVQKLPIHPWYKYATAMIVLGVIGNYIDWIFFSHGRLHYLFTDYIWFHFIGPVLSISTIMNSLCWILLFVSLIKAFRDLKVIFTFRKIDPLPQLKE